MKRETEPLSISEPPSLFTLLTPSETEQSSFSIPQDSKPDIIPQHTEDQWNDWKWQMSNRLTTVEHLTALLGLDALQTQKYSRLIDFFHYAITPYYLSLIDWSNPKDPVRLQCIPDHKELECEVVGTEDPLEEVHDSKVPGLVHRYPNRVLAVVTNTCAMYCRHCTRKRIWHDGESFMTKPKLQAMADYVKRTPIVREVVVSGGDPLAMNPNLLDWFLGELGTIPHLEVVRIGSRVPVVLPMRITKDIVSMLASHRPLWFNTQFNHPQELTPESAMACDRLLTSGIPVSNQSVLLRGINDSVETMLSLCHGLMKMMVRPYYLFQCDPVKGTEHFRTSIWKGIEIIENMRGHTSGLAIPTFVVDAVGGGGKIPLQPFYLLSTTEEEVTLRNYEGQIFKYYNPLPQPKKNGTSQKKIKRTVSSDMPRPARIRRIYAN